MKTLHIGTMTLLWVGGINLGLMGLLQFNLVEALFGGLGLTNMVYVLVGLAAAYSVYIHMVSGECKVCRK